jgi:hypothetical protein
MAYTLLTFGYVIPAGLENWGVLLKRAEREAFLHTWKVIGYLMGLREDLLTDDLDEARTLFDTILKRQGGRSDMGVRLTDSVCHVLEEYLPSFLGSRKALPPLLIIDQLGHATAGEILSDDAIRDARSLRGRATWAALKLGLWLYMRLKTFVYRNPGEITSSIEPIIHRAGEALFESWRGPFTRRAFFIPETFAGGWQVQAGAGEALKERVRRWRKRIFYVIGGGLLAAILATVSLIVTLVASPFVGWHFIWAGTAVTLASGVLALYLYEIQLPRTIKGRPKFPYEQSLPAPKPKSGGA